MAPKKDTAPPPSSKPAKSGGGKQKERERPTFRMYDKTKKTKMDPIWLHATFPYRRTWSWPKGTKNFSEHEFLEYLDQKKKEAEENRNFRELRKIEEERKAYMREQKHKIWALLREKMPTVVRRSTKHESRSRNKETSKGTSKAREARKLKILEKAKMFGYKEGDDVPEKGQGSKEGDDA